MESRDVDATRTCRGLSMSLARLRLAIAISVGFAVIIAGCAQL
jgi:hypothetical protein